MGRGRSCGWVRALGAALAAGAVALGATGCAELRGRGAPPPTLHTPRTIPPMVGGPGSLWRGDRAANYPFVDVRPRFPGDLLTVLISESARGAKNAETSTESEASISGSIEEFFGLPQILPDISSDINPSSLAKAAAKRTFDGTGETSRTGSLTGQITVTVTAVEPNGNLHVEGQKVVTINSEEQYIVLQGVVRPEDIDGTNTVPSTRLADARIDFYGSGVVGDKQRPGFGFRLLDWVWPF
jgi:flagellar L-ring protein precursor FlgH